MVNMSENEHDEELQLLEEWSIQNLEIDYSGIGRRVKEIRKQRGLTQSQLSEICGCDTSTLSHLENGSGKISLTLLYRCSVALEKNIGYFLVDSPMADLAPIIESASDPKWKLYSKASLDLMDTIHKGLVTYEAAVRKECTGRIPQV